MISNPCSWFATGGNSEDIVEFIYEGGTYLYHFSPHDNGLSGTMETNIVFFANDEEHARDVFRRMLLCRLDCEEKFLKAEGSSHHRYGVSKAEGYLACIDDIKFTLAPVNQFYVVGWACNDTIL